MEFLDQLGNTVCLSKYPQRIISLVPSLTELLFDLGLDNEVVGVTLHCLFPEHKVASRVKIGGIKQFDFHAIDNLKPDLLIGNKEENYKEGILRLQDKYPVWMSDIVTIDDALRMIKGVGAIVNRTKHADQLIKEIIVELDTLPIFLPIKVAYLIWNNPYMVAAGGTFINEMLHICGFINIFDHKCRYPQIDMDELTDADVILLSSEPYSFTAKDIDPFRRRFPHHKVLLVDGMMFSWYGSRLKYAPRYLKDLRRLL